jgi:hypothetical protein
MLVFLSFIKEYIIKDYLNIDYEILSDPEIEVKFARYLFSFNQLFYVGFCIIHLTDSSYSDLYLAIYHIHFNFLSYQLFLNLCFNF